MRIDFTAYFGMPITKTWNVSQTIDTTTTPVDLTSAPLKLKLFDRGNLVAVAELDPISKGSGFCTFTFAGADLDDYPIYDYVIEWTAVTVIAAGTITVVKSDVYIPFSDIVDNELPAGLTLSPTFVSLKAYEWRLTLQHSPSPPILDVDVRNEAAWPFLYNVLIAKLVVYDHILKLMKGLVTSESNQGGETTVTNGGGLKSITTGPAQVEWYDAKTSVSNFTKADASGNSGFSNLAKDICALAGRLGVYLPEICGIKKSHPIVPLKAGRVCPTVKAYGPEWQP